ncbi:MAG: hypothetical protein AB3N20_20425 [Rhizobiaceae bacterium]
MRLVFAEFGHRCTVAGLVVVFLWSSLRTGIERAPVKMFQWFLFLVASIAFLMAAISSGGISDGVP